MCGSDLNRLSLQPRESQMDLGFPASSSLPIHRSPSACAAENVDTAMPSSCQQLQDEQRKFKQGKHQAEEAFIAKLFAAIPVYWMCYASLC